jgi:hypothetical protein
MFKRRQDTDLRPQCKILVGRPSHGLGVSGTCEPSFGVGFCSFFPERFVSRPKLSSSPNGLAEGGPAMRSVESGYGSRGPISPSAEGSFASAAGVAVSVV